MASVPGGYQPNTRQPASRRADFDLLRRIARLEILGGPDASGVPNEVTIGGLAPTDSSELWVSSANILYAKVDDEWVAVLGGGEGGGEVGPPPGSSWVIAPAETGARSDAVDQARFGNMSDTSKQVGFFSAASGENLVINANGQTFSLWDRTADGTSYRQLASFSLGLTTVSAGDVRLGQWRFHDSPHTGCALLPTANDPTSGYTLLAAYGSTYLNCPTGGSLNFRVGQVQYMSLTPTTFTCNPTLSCNAISSGAINTNGQGLTTGAISCGNINAGTGTINCGTINSSAGVGAVVFGANAGNRTGNWSGAHFTAYNPAGDYHGARIGFYASGAASQWWLGYPNGGSLVAMNDQNSGTVGIIAAAFSVGSALAIKKDVRTLRPERERITVQRDPASDLVAQPDIMALRPVAFRPRILMQLDGEDYPADTVLGRETRRERLGLIADEVQHVIPSAVIHNTDNEVVGIDYAQVTVALLDHVQELTRTVETLQYRIAELEQE